MTLKTLNQWRFGAQWDTQHDPAVPLWAQRLRMLRQHDGLSAEYVSEHAGISVATLSRVESGKLPSIETALGIARFYEMPVEALFPVTGINEKGNDAFDFWFYDSSGRQHRVKGIYRELVRCSECRHCVRDARPEYDWGKFSPPKSCQNIKQFFVLNGVGHTYFPQSACCLYCGLPPTESTPLTTGWGSEKQCFWEHGEEPYGAQKPPQNPPPKIP